LPKCYKMNFECTAREDGTSTDIMTSYFTLSWISKLCLGMASRIRILLCSLTSSLMLAGVAAWLKR
jgi:hypothetical protein